MDMQDGPCLLTPTRLDLLIMTPAIFTRLREWAIKGERF
jgi:hypothetical protein